MAPARRLTGTSKRAGHACLAAIALIIVVWALSPAIPQDQSYHQFADRRSWHELPNAADVLSNLAFALVGDFRCRASPVAPKDAFARSNRAGMWLIALGIIGTAIGSAWYHYNPTDVTLVWDRLPMTVVFAGVLGAAISQRLGEPVGRRAMAILVPVGIASVAYWTLTGDLSLYLAVQFGGIAALALLLAITRGRDDPIPWLWLVAFYIAAKVAEVGDRAIWDASQGLVAGHTLKHLFAAVAVAAALWPLRPRG